LNLLDLSNTTQEITMKNVLIAIAALAVTSAFVGQASAAPERKLTYFETQVLSGS